MVKRWGQSWTHSRTNLDILYSCQCSSSILNAALSSRTLFLFEKKEIVINLFYWELNFLQEISNEKTTPQIFFLFICHTHTHLYFLVFVCLYLGYFVDFILLSLLVSFLILLCYKFISMRSVSFSIFVSIEKCCK